MGDFKGLLLVYVISCAWPCWQVKYHFCIDVIYEYDE